MVPAEAIFVMESCKHYAPFAEHGNTNAEYWKFVAASRRTAAHNEVRAVTKAL